MLWAGALAAAALALSGGVLSVVTVSEVAHTDIVSTGLDVEGNVVLGAVGILLTVLSGWWGVRCEHLLRHRHPAIRRLTASQSLFRGWRRERHGPTSTALGLAVYVVFVGLMVPGVVSGYHDARHSSDTQHGGARRDGTIVKIVYVGQFGRSGIRYPNYLYSTSESMVELSSPVAGHRSTTLHYRSSSENPGMSFSVGNNMVGAGRVVQVLVDPKDPAYSEFPGFPVVGSSAWIVPLLFVLIVACVPLVLSARSLARQMRRRLGSAATLDSHLSAPRWK
jgi:hypothetical protein